MSNKKVRVRFAPSPTGPLHIGGVRTALFNYLFARKHGGDFILRIEDTDQTRYVEGAEKYIIESLKWCGLDFDESVEKGGQYGPYRQSDRKEIYKQYAQQLIENGQAYYAFDTPEELDQMRSRLQEAKAANQQYGPTTRAQMNNSLTMTAEEVQQKISTGAHYVVRFKMPENFELEVSDIVRGKVTFNTSTLDDKVLFKSDGMPTYHLANVVDDNLMKISHVIRGEEWLPSMPLHVLLYKAFGWDDNMPQFAHLPLLLKPVGKGKLSKRDGDKMGFPVFPLKWITPEGETYAGYKEDGYFADAFVNLLALLGWNDGTDQELFTLEELCQKFSLERVGKSGARFDPEKAKWFNHQYLLNKSDEEIAVIFAEELKNKGIESTPQYLTKVCSMVKDRANFVNEIWDHASFFFEAPVEYDAKIIKKRWKENTPQIIKDIVEKIAAVDSFDATTLEPIVKDHIADNELNMGQVMNCLRMSLVGGAKGPDLFNIFEMLGKEEATQRLIKAVDTIVN